MQWRIKLFLCYVSNAVTIHKWLWFGLVRWKEIGWCWCAYILFCTFSHGKREKKVNKRHVNMVILTLFSLLNIERIPPKTHKIDCGKKRGRCIRKIIMRRHIDSIYDYLAYRKQSTDIQTLRSILYKPKPSIYQHITRRNKTTP